MRAIDVSGQAPGGQRQKLADQLPLDTPLLVQFFPIYACNFRCVYCVFSAPHDRRGFITDQSQMSFELFRKCIDDLRQFPSKARVIRFVGMGEPLLHPLIASMVSYAQVAADRLEILTNGSLLTKELSEKLVAAGLTRLLVSIQGTSDEKYRELSQTSTALESIVENVRYFYEHRGKTQLHAKIVDVALDGEDDKQRFFQLFGDICDTIGIEQVGPIFPAVDYRGVIYGERELTQYGLPAEKLTVCPQPFFTMQINPDGKIVPCYSLPYPIIIGDANAESLLDIWKGETLRKFRRASLDGLKVASPVCANCQIACHRRWVEDDLSLAIERLKLLYGEKR